MKRLNSFLSSSELTNYISRNKDDRYCISLDNCSFSWSKAPTELGKAAEATAKPLLSRISMKIKANSFVAIVGNVGSGKSSLLNAILGNMELTEGSINVYVWHVVWRIKNVVPCMPLTIDV